MAERIIKISPKTKEMRSIKLDTHKENKPSGLANFGNTCFFNSALQLFSSSFRFNVFSKNLKDSSETDFLEDLLNAIQPTDDLTRHKSLVKKVYEKKGSWDLGYQQDSHECIIFVLDLLDIRLRIPENPSRNHRKVSLGKDYDEIMRSFGKYYWEDYTYRMHDVVKSFHGLYHSSTTCCVCKNENNKWDLFSNITLTTEYKKFTDFLENFSKEEQIENYDCEKCKKKTNATKQIEVWRYPKTLLLHSLFKTFTSLNTELIIEEPDHGKCVFDLKGVVFHDGPDIDSGHYYCAVKKNKDWFIVNDTQVFGPIDHKVDLKQHVKSSYILLYERISKTNRDI